MALAIPSFIFVFILCILYFNVRDELRTAVLCAGSLGYVFFLSRYAAAAVLTTGLLGWLAGVLLGALMRRGLSRMATAAAGVCIGVCAAALLGMKLRTGLSPRPGIGSAGTGFPMLVGFSFYIFQTISYLADIRSGRVLPEKNPFRVILYLAWFPKFMSGPLERKTDFDRELVRAEKAVFFDPERLERALHFILLGCLYKLVIADRFGLYANMLFDRYESFGSFWLAAGVFLYTIQIYCDFAGYSYAAVGISLLFGLELTINFSMPYLSANITEFWRRWHCSLSSWLRDYVYIPLGGGRKGERRKIVHVLLVFLLCGLWHGIGAHFIIWGLLHGVYSAVDGAAGRRHWEFFRKGVTGRLVTGTAVAFAWIFFRAPSARAAAGYIGRMLTAGTGRSSLVSEFYVLGLDKIELSIMLVSLIFMAIMEYHAYRSGREVPEVLLERPYVLRLGSAFVLLAVILVLGMYGPAYHGEMIYMEF